MNDNTRSIFFRLLGMFIGFFLFFAIGCLWWLLGHPMLGIYEDGSWRILIFTGCIPNMLCQ